MLKHPINPLIDCVFKALLGDPANEDLLLSFLNAIVQPASSFTAVEILNPYVPQEFVGDDLRVLDIRARDQTGRQIQIEVQLVVERWLTSRVVYTWADLYQSQIQRGESFVELQPVLSVWVLAGNLLDSPHWHHRFRLCDDRAGVLLSDHAEIHTVELRKWRKPATPLAPDDAWVYFLREAHAWHELPSPLHTPLMEKAMSVLERFSSKADDYHNYQSRMNFLREQASIAADRARLEAEREKAEAEREKAEADLARSESGREKAETDLARSEAEREKAEADLARSESEREKAEADLARSEADRVRLEAEREKAEADLARSESEREKADAELSALRERLRALGLDREAGG